MHRVKFGDVVREVKAKVDRNNNPYEFYVAGDHMDTEDLTIRRRGLFATDDVGPAFIREFRRGQILYGSRRTYLKKVAVADFDGVTANTTFVLETVDESILRQRLIPFIMLSEGFTAWSIKKSKGSTNPYVLFSDIAAYEFDLPDIEVQDRLVKALWSIVETQDSYKKLLEKTDELVKSQFMEMFETAGFPTVKLADHFELRMGKTPAREVKRFWDSRDYRWVSIADLGTFAHFTGDTKEYISQTAVDETGIKIIPKSTVIMSFKLTIGKTAITSEDIYTNEAIMAFIPKSDEFLTEYLRLCLGFKDWTMSGKQAVKGVTLNKESIGEAEIVLPPLPLQEQFAEFVRQSDKSKLSLLQTFQNFF